jgi:hypothetical protein
MRLARREPMLRPVADQLTEARGRVARTDGRVGAGVSEATRLPCSTTVRGIG